MNEQIRFGSLNHNETVVADPVRFGLGANHNETVVADPRVRFGSLNHNETVVVDR